MSGEFLVQGINCRSYQSILKNIYYGHRVGNSIGFDFAIFDKLIGVPRGEHVFQQALLTMF